MIKSILVFIGILSLTPIQSRKIPGLNKGIAGNLASIDSNIVGIKSNADNILTNDDDIQALERMGSGSVWFDAFRYMHFINISHQRLS